MTFIARNAVLAVTLAASLGGLPSGGHAAAADAKAVIATYEAIAQASGVDTTTVHKSLKNSELENSNSEQIIISKDGKKRPATYAKREPKPAVMVKAHIVVGKKWVKVTHSIKPKQTKSLFLIKPEGGVCGGARRIDGCVPRAGEGKDVDRETT